MITSVALMTGQYHGRPVPAHTPLPINAAHFDRWLALFRAIAVDTCTPAGALHLIERAEPTALTRHIEERYHARHREQLPQLVAMAERVEDVHFGDVGVPDGLSALLHEMLGELEAHMKKEELILFPAIRKGGMPGIETPIAVMRADHAGHDRELAEILRLTANLTLPDGACGTWTGLYRGLDEFTRDLAEHMRLENDVLFPQFEAERRADV